MMLAVPLPLSMKATPDGSAPLSLNAGVGVPVVVTVNDPAVPAVKVALLALVMAGAPLATVKLCVTVWLSSVAVALPDPLLVGVTGVVAFPVPSIVAKGEAEKAPTVDVKATLSPWRAPGPPGTVPELESVFTAASS
jgi:hypothetical protein